MRHQSYDYAQWFGKPECADYSFFERRFFMLYLFTPQTHYYQYRWYRAATVLARCYSFCMELLGEHPADSEAAPFHITFEYCPCRSAFSALASQRNAMRLASIFFSRCLSYPTYVCMYVVVNRGKEVQFKILKFKFKKIHDILTFNSSWLGLFQATQKNCVEFNLIKYAPLWYNKTFLSHTHSYFQTNTLEIIHAALLPSTFQRNTCLQCKSICLFSTQPLKVHSN